MGLCISDTLQITRQETLEEMNKYMCIYLGNFNDTTKHKNPLSIVNTYRMLNLQSNYTVYV